jgi:hypothetical protein
VNGNADGSSHIDSDLRWNQVRLPSPLSEADFDTVVLSALGRHWRKVAAIVIRVVEKYEHTHPAITYEIVAARLKALSDADMIEAQGDLRKWRFSEVRLKS